MKFISKIKVNPEIPASISRIKELAYNVWWVWNSNAQRLYTEIDEKLWDNVYHNPVKFLLEITQAKLEKAAKSPAYLELYKNVLEKFDSYMKPKDTWFSRTLPNHKSDLIAYFSAEYGIHESLPIYSGGLGILAGDHVKSASDIGLPYVGVGLLYKQGYFTQKINIEGWQEANYTELDFNQLPLNKALDDKGNHLKITVDLPGRKVSAQIWYIQAGRVRVYLLDTNIQENKPEDRWFTSQLYGGDQEMRITQEILLGIGGVKALRALGLKPTVWHMNEGHSVFMGLERIRELVEKDKIAFYDALEVIKSNTIFTTHTPVPAGNDAFPLNLQAKYFKNYWEQVHISESQFMDLGKEIESNGYQIFSLTVLALKLASRANGVSELHGHVSRKLWEKVWEGVPFEENPITHITNGVHTETWIAPEMHKLYDEHFGDDWKENLSNRKFWEKISAIPDKAIWQTHQLLKKRMVDFVRERAITQWTRHGTSISDIAQNADTLLDPEYLTIGFARRFATYKRAILIFKDIERLKKILNNPDMPMQIVFAGKAHPKDKPGQEFIKAVFDTAKMEGFKGKIFFVEDYDMNVARYLVQGVDIWLNTPRRPYEASGTSGQKGPINGVINFSVLDGWWRESFDTNSKSGWSIGLDRDYPSLEAQDIEDARDIYNQLEREIIPLYYTRDKEGIPAGWVKRMKESIQTVVPNFSTDRMVKDYTQKLYIPAALQGKNFAENNYQLGKDVNAWKNHMISVWNQVSINADSAAKDSDIHEVTLSEGIKVSAIINLDGIKPEDISAEIYFRKIDGSQGEICGMKVAEVLGKGKARFEGVLKPTNGGNYEYTIRVIPFHPGLAHKHETGLIRWME